jgi:hypothetical protein
LVNMVLSGQTPRAADSSIYLPRPAKANVGLQVGEALFHGLQDLQLRGRRLAQSCQGLHLCRDPRVLLRDKAVCLLKAVGPSLLLHALQAEHVSAPCHGLNPRCYAR